MNLRPERAVSEDERRRVLICAPFPPRLDARHGGKAPAQLLRRLADRNEVALLCLRQPHEPGVDPEIARRCAAVDEVSAELPGGALVRRVAWGLGMLRGLPPWASDCRSDEYAARLNRMLDEWRPDIVEIHLQAMAQYVDAAAKRNVPRILVDYDPPSAWAEDVLKTTRGPRRLARWIEVAAWRRYERATRRHFDAIVAFAERDLAAIEPTAGPAAVLRIPLAVEVPSRPLDPQGADPPTVVFIGSFAHPPNVDAALWLGRTVFPRVLERVPDARLDIVGNEPGEDIRALAGGAVSVHGSVPDVTPYLDRAAVVVAPIRLGGSMRMKVLEALAAGKVLVATARAAEGVEAAPGEHFVLADDEEALVEALAGLLIEPERRRALGQRARVWAEQHLGWERGAEAFEALYDRLTAGTPQPPMRRSASGR
jgi:glycosyltransferase involved in cell wall biosynthesis